MSHKRNLVWGIVLAVLFAAIPAQAKTHVVKAYSNSPKSTVRVDNPTRLGFHVFVDGHFRGKVRSGGELVLPYTSTGRHVVVAKYPGKQPVPPQRFEVLVKPHTLATVRLRSPTGAMRVHNPNPVSAMLFVDGKRRRRLAPGASVTVRGLTMGAHTFDMLAAGTRSKRVRLMVTPGRISTWQPAPVVGALKLYNGSHYNVSVKLDHKQVGHIQAGKTLSLKVLPVGVHRVVTTNSAGHRFIHTITVEAHKTSVWRVA
jgi:hypothetical protein